MALCVSRCTNDGLSATSRDDPMYETPWCGDSAAAWLSRRRADVEHARSGAAYPPGAIRDRGEARDLVAAHAPTSAAALGALAVHGTLSIEQVAAFVGVETTELIAGGALRALWSMGAVKFGHVTNTWDHRWERTLWTIADKKVIAAQVLPLLSGPEVVALTAGHDIHLSKAHDRHAVLAAELALRIAEYTAVGTVVGERLSDLKSLFHRPTTRRLGDVTAVRPDGFRVVLEVVAHDNQAFGKKVDFWADQLATPGHGYGMTMVVFVVAADPSSSASRARGLTGRVSTAIENARARYGVGWRGHERMAMVSWNDWFPAAGLMSRAFSSLTVRLPGSRTTRGSVLDPRVVPCAYPFALEYLAVIENASVLAQTAAWLRSRTQAASVFRRMGVPQLTDLPVPPAAKPDRPRSSSRARGAAGPAQPPPRLQGIPGERAHNRARTGTVASPPPPPPAPQQAGPTTLVRRRRPRSPQDSATAGPAPEVSVTHPPCRRSAPGSGVEVGDPGQDVVDDRREAAAVPVLDLEQPIVDQGEVGQALGRGCFTNADHSPAGGEQGKGLVAVAAPSIRCVVIPEAVVLDDQPQRRHDDVAACAERSTAPVRPLDVTHVGVADRIAASVDDGSEETPLLV